jgi:outer membrane protein assembly factor BamB
MNKYWLPVLLLVFSVSLSSCSHLPSWAGGKKEEKAKLSGERISALPASAETKPDETIKDMPVTLPPATANSDWQQHTGIFTAATANLAAKGHFDNVTSATAGKGESFEHIMVPRPVVGGGKVFAMDGVGNISAHDAANIKKILWKSKGISEEDEPDIMGGGLAYDQDRLYATSGRGAVMALDASSGKVIWRKAMHLPFRASPKVAGGKLYVITIDNQVYALNASDGDIAWNQRGISEAAGMMNSVSPVVAGEAVVVPYSSGEIYVLAAVDGKEIWSDSLSPGKRTQASALFAGIGGDPVVDGAVVCAVSSGGMVSVQALATGQHVWQRPIGSLNTPWIAGDFLFLISNDNVLISFVKYDGRIRWATKLDSYEDEKAKKHPLVWKGPVLVADQLAMVSSNGRLLLADAGTGKVAAIKSIPEDIYTAPVVAGGRMYLVGQDATLYSVQ